VGWGGEVGVVCLRRQTPEGGFPASLLDIAARCSRTPREVPEPFGVTATEGLKLGQDSALLRGLRATPQLGYKGQSPGPVCPDLEIW